MNKYLYRFIVVLTVFAVVLPVTSALSAEESEWKALKKEEKREKIDMRAAENLEVLLAASANAAAWKSGVNKATAFIDGLAIYQMTDGGLMVNADIAGTKYWKDGNLNNE